MCWLLLDFTFWKKKSTSGLSISILHSGVNINEITPFHFLESFSSLSQSFIFNYDSSILHRPCFLFFLRNCHSSSHLFLFLTFFHRTTLSRNVVLILLVLLQQRRNIFSYNFKEITSVRGSYVYLLYIVFFLVFIFSFCSMKYCSMHTFKEVELGY